jgi:hypothetical protein
LTGFHLAVGFGVLYSFNFKSGVAGIHGPVRPFEAPLGGKSVKRRHIGVLVRAKSASMWATEAQESAGRCFSCLWSGSVSGHVG